MTDKQKNDDTIVSSEEQLQVTEACQKMLEATGCDYIICLFPTKDGSEEIIKSKINIKNLVGHFNTVAEKTAESLGVTREKALIRMAAAGSMTIRSKELN